MHHLQDQAILRKAHGLKQIAAVQHTKPTAKPIPKKRLAVSGGDAAAVKVSKVAAPAAGAAVYPVGIQSPIAALQSSAISSRSKKAMPPGTNKGIPLDRQKYCEFCHKWAVDYSGHQTSARHTANVNAGITWFWCYICEDSVLASNKQSHVCMVG